MGFNSCRHPGNHPGKQDVGSFYYAIKFSRTPKFDLPSIRPDFTKI